MHHSKSPNKHIFNGLVIYLVYSFIISGPLFIIYQYFIRLISMNERHAVSVQQLYSTANRLNQVGIQGYRIHANYFDAAKEIEQRQISKRTGPAKDRRYKTKKGNYLDDEQKLHKSVPGPGHYPITSQWPSVPKLKIRHADKKTYIDQIMKREKKEKRPAPGHYNTFKSLKEMDAARKQLAIKKIPYQQRTNFLDNSQFQSTQYPGAGNYNPRDRIKTEYSKVRTKPEDWRKKHQELSKKKPPKYPPVAAYNPLPADISLFEHMQKTKKEKNSLGKVQRFKTTPTGSGLPPAKYSVLQEWRGKDKKKVERHGMEVLARTTYKSVYYH